MAGLVPPVISSREFIRATTPTNILKRGRSSLREIDTLLGLFDTPPLEPDRKMKLLVDLIRACKKWLFKKKDKTSANSLMRRQHVIALADQAFARLQYEQFERRKAMGPRLGTKGLSGGYQHERTTYLSSGKSAAVSGSTLGFLYGDGKVPATRMGFAPSKPFSQVSVEEFEQLVKTFGPMFSSPTHVHFFTKNERMKWLISIQDGIFFNGFTQRFDTNGKTYPYAMDRYGNLFSLEHTSFEKDLSMDLRFNHSTFNAGKEVISAGLLRVQNGQLRYIDNASGHYKPTRQNMMNLLGLLKEEGVDLYASVAVGIAEPSNGQVMISTYNNAAVLLQNPAVRPDSVKVLAG